MKIRVQFYQLKLGCGYLNTFQIFDFKILALHKEIPPTYVHSA